MTTTNNLKRLLYNAIVTRNDVYAIQKADGNYLKIESPLTIEKLLKAPNETVGVYLLGKQNQVKCTIVDIDILKDNFNKANCDITRF